MNAVSVILFLVLSIIVRALTETRLADLVFPKGSTFSVSVTIGIPLPKPKGFFEAVELDFLYPVVDKAGVPKKTFRVNPYTHMYRPAWDRHRFRQNEIVKARQRRDVRGQVERALERFGYDGRACRLRFSCEVNNITKPDSLVEDLLLVFFRDRNVDCSHSRTNCPFSLLQIILNSQQVGLSV